MSSPSWSTAFMKASLFPNALGSIAITRPLKPAPTIIMLSPGAISARSSARTQQPGRHLFSGKICGGTERRQRNTAELRERLIAVALRQQQPRPRIARDVCLRPAQSGRALVPDRVGFVETRLCLGVTAGLRRPIGLLHQHEVQRHRLRIVLAQIVDFGVEVPSGSLEAAVGR